VSVWVLPARRAAARLKPAPVGAAEDELAGGVPGDAVAALVHEAMVVRAQPHEIVRAGGAAVRPVHDVVRVQVATVRTAGKATAAVALVEQAVDAR
jgi:hypothetical protein